MSLSAPPRMVDRKMAAAARGEKKSEANVDKSRDVSHCWNIPHMVGSLWTNDERGSSNETGEGISLTLSNHQSAYPSGAAGIIPVRSPSPVCRVAPNWWFWRSSV